jgi:hypothetical protein
MAGKAFDILNRLIKDSGVEDVSGFGMSSIAREKGFFHSKAMLHHYKGKGSGFLWNLFGQKEHALTSLDLLPASTALASFHDLDLALLWSVIQKEAAQSGFPEATAFLNQVPEQFEKVAGLKWNEVLNSLGGEYGFVLTLDPNKKMTIPIPGADSPLEMPEPALMLVIKVKNATIFTRIDDALKENSMGATSVDKPDLKMRTVPVPIPLPLPLRPSIATSGGYLFIATTDTLIQDALAVKSGQKPGLKSTPEFKRLAADVPTQGNSFSFVSQRFGETIVQIQRTALPMATKAQPAQAEFLQSFLTSTNAAFAYSVAANTDEGWLTVGNGNQHPAKMIAVAAIVPAAIAAGVTLPAVAKAKARAESGSQ